MEAPENQVLGALLVDQLLLFVSPEDSVEVEALRADLQSVPLAIALIDASFSSALSELSPHQWTHSHCYRHRTRILHLGEYSKTYAVF